MLKLLINGNAPEVCPVITFDINAIQNDDFVQYTRHRLN